MLRRTLFAFAAAAMCTTSPLWAQDTMRVRGTVEGMDGGSISMLSVQFG